MCDFKMIDLIEVILSLSLFRLKICKLQKIIIAKQNPVLVFRLAYMYPSHYDDFLRELGYAMQIKSASMQYYLYERPA